MAQVLPEYNWPRGRVSEEGSSSTSFSSGLHGQTADDGRGAHGKSIVEPAIQGGSGLLPKLGSSLQALLLIAALAVAAYLHTALQEMNTMLQDARRLTDSSSDQPAAAAASRFNRSSSATMHHEESSDEMLVDPGFTVPSRRLGLMTVGTDNNGCYLASNTATYDVSDASCSSKNCPSCFISAETPASAVTLTISNCMSHRWGLSTSSPDTRSGVWQYTFINRGTNYDMTITDGTGSFVLSPLSFVHAYCSDKLSRLIFPTTTMPTLTVQAGLTLESGVLDASGSSSAVTLGSGGVTIADGGLTVTAGGFTLSDGAFTAGGTGNPGSFTTSGGTVTINGPTSIPGTGDTFTVGPGASTLGGTLAVTGATTISGGATIDSGLTVQTGDITLTAGNFAQSSPTATFSTGGGAVTVNGDTTIVNPATFTVGASAGNGGTSTFYGSLVANTPGSAPAHGVTITGGLDVDRVDASGDVTVDGGLDMSAGTGAFSTGTGGTVALNGAVTISGGITQGAASPATSDAVRFYGNVEVGNSPTSIATLTVSGATTINSGGLDVVAGGITMQAGDFDASPGSGAFKTTTGGSVTLSSNTKVDDGYTFTVGSVAPGTAGDTTFWGNVNVGAPGFSAGTTTIYNGASVASGALSVTPGSITLGGSFTQSGAGTFTTGTGDVTLAGGTVYVTPGSLEVTDPGSATIFSGTVQVSGASTLTGAVTAPGGLAVLGGASFGGAVTLTGSFDASNGGSNTAAFTTSSGTNTLSGNVVVADSATVTVGSAGAGGATTIYGALTVGASGDEVPSSFYGQVEVTSPATGILVSGGGITVNGGGIDGTSATGTFDWGATAATFGKTVSVTSGITVGTSADDGSGPAYVNSYIYGNLVIGSATGTPGYTSSFGTDLVISPGYSLKYGTYSMACEGTSPYYCAVDTSR